jgi:hypothetical protein
LLITWMEEPNQLQICRFFTQGSCKRIDTCRYSRPSEDAHPAPTPL